MENLFTFASHDGGIPMGKELQSYYLLVQGVNSPVLYYSLQIQTFDIDIFIYFASVFFFKRPFIFRTNYISTSILEDICWFTLARIKYFVVFRHRDVLRSYLHSS